MSKFEDFGCNLFRMVNVWGGWVGGWCLCVVVVGVVAVEGGVN